MGYLLSVSYFLSAILFILGLKKMSSPVTARPGIIWAGFGMILATVVTFFDPHLSGVSNYVLMVLAIVIGGGLSYYYGKIVKMTDMPQMIALFNGMGGAAAGAIGIVEVLKALGEGGSVTSVLSPAVAIIAILGVFIGLLSFSGSLVAWAKLDGRLHRNALIANQHIVNVVVLVLIVLFGYWLYHTNSGFILFLFVLLVLASGVLITTPVGGADMPVAISLFNAMTGIAVGLEGYVLNNPAMMIAGTVVGSAGTLLTLLMAKAMNRSVYNVLVGGFGQTPAAEQDSNGPSGQMKAIQAQDAGINMAYGSQVIIAPGYGLAVAQAQHKLWEFAQLLEKQGVVVKFAIHPVAGRMPGHMNVLLAEAGVPYDKIFDMEEINSEFANTSVALVIGANDVVNPSAKDDKSSPLYGMPVLDVDQAQSVIVIKRGQGKGFSGVENALFFMDNTQMLYGDAQKVLGELVTVIKSLQ